MNCRYAAWIRTVTLGVILAVAVTCPGQAPVASGPSVVEFSKDSYLARENDGEIGVILTRTGNTNQTAIVHLAATNGTAVAGADYRAVSRLIVLGPGMLKTTVPIPLLDNTNEDRNRTVELVLSEPGEGTALGTVRQATLTIQDNDGAAVAWIALGLDRVPVLKKPIAGIPLWQYMVSFLYIFLAFYVSKFLDILIRGRLRQMARKTRFKFDDLLLEVVQGPIRILSFVVLLRIGMQVFAWPTWLESFFSKLLTIIVAVAITYVCLKVIDLAMGLWKEKGADQERLLDDQLHPIIRKSLKLFVVIVASLVTAQNLEFDITALLASLSIGGLALGLAAQDTLSNLFGAVAIFADKPFRIGDRIQLDSVDGVVETIGLRSTRVRNLDGHLITIPNKTMGNATITNITSRPNIKTIMTIGITYNTPTPKLKRALAILQEIYKGHPKTFDVWISFKEFADSSLAITVIHWYGSTVYKEYLEGMQELNLAVKERFDAEGIEFAFPTRTLYVKQDSDWRFGKTGEEANES